MDLVATVTRKEDVDVWRLNGQKVFGANFSKAEDDDDDGAADLGKAKVADEGPVNIMSIGWRRDGQILAVACADGTVSLINAFTGKIAHRISTQTLNRPSSNPSSQQSQTRQRSSKVASQPPSLATISTLSWTTHFAYPSAETIRSRIASSNTAVSLDQILSLRADVDRLLQLKADLPRELSNIDIESSLPKLATLPPTGVGIDDDVFSSRGSVDVIFHGGGSNAGSGGAGGVDAMIVGMSGDHDGRCGVHLRIFDSFEVGTVDFSELLPTYNSDTTARVVSMESHPFLSTVYLIVELSNAQDPTAESSLHVLSLDLSFIPRTGRNLPLVAKKATQLANLLRYISQVEKQLVAEVKAAFDLPSRFLRNINESLAETDENADFVAMAHHLAVTGDCDPKLKEWLVDEVGDRGLKRWEKAVGDCLEVVRRMTSECLLPALERCLVVLSRLDGLAAFQATSSRLGLDEQSITKVRESVDAMGILAEDLLLDVGLEMREFACFMKWLKWECEVEALEESSERAEELRETWTGEAELKMVLAYVGGAMKHSRLKKYLVKDEMAQNSGTASFDGNPDVGFYIEYTKRRGGGSNEKKMPTMGDMVERLRKQSGVVFGHIAESFRKSVLAAYMFELPGHSERDKMNVRVVPDDDPTLFRLIAIAADKQAQDSLRHVATNLRQGSGKDSKYTTETNLLTIPDVKSILDCKFIDDKSFLVLAETAFDIRVYSHDAIAEMMQGGFEVKHVFEQGLMDSGMRPARLDVNGRDGRRVVAVLDIEGQGYAVFDLDADDQRDDDRDSLMSG